MDLPANGPSDNKADSEVITHEVNITFLQTSRIWNLLCYIIYLSK